LYKSAAASWPVSRWAALGPCLQTPQKALNTRAARLPGGAAAICSPSDARLMAGFCPDTLDGADNSFGVLIRDFVIAVLDHHLAAPMRKFDQAGLQLVQPRFSEIVEVTRCAVRIPSGSEHR